MSAAPDPRVNAYRPDLAAASLRGVVRAERYVDGVACQMRAGFAALNEEPSFESRQASQLLFGEVFTVYEERDGWAWGQNATDGYVGWTRIEGLEMEPAEPTHTVAALRTYLFPAPDLKTPPLDMLSLGCAVTVTGTEGNWSAVAGGGFVYSRHLATRGAKPADPVDTALRFLEAPYLWGGRTSLGLDCSALVQLALAAAGIACPRDSDQQAAAVGALVSDDGAGHAFRRGDIVFFPGHVGIMADATDLVHANAFHMCVAREPLAEVVRRAGDKGISAVRRLG